VPFQISTLEFSPDARNWIGYAEFKFEAGCCPVARDRAWSSRKARQCSRSPNLELNEAGEILMMQLNLLGGPKRA
jgi:hypothetical protein